MATIPDKTSSNRYCQPCRVAAPNIEILNHKTFQYCPNDIALPTAAKAAVRFQLHLCATYRQCVAQYSPTANCCYQITPALAVPTFLSPLPHGAEKFQLDGYVPITTTLHALIHG